MHQISIQPENWSQVSCASPVGVDDVGYNEGFDRFSVYVEKLSRSDDAEPSPVQIELRAGTYQSTETLLVCTFDPSLMVPAQGWNTAGLVAQIGNRSVTSLEIWARTMPNVGATDPPASLGVIFTVMLERAGQSSSSAITIFTGELVV